MFTQERLLDLDIPVLNEPLLLIALNGCDYLSHPFYFELTVLSENAGLGEKELMGASMTVSLGRGESKQTYHMRVYSFSKGAADHDGLYTYKLIGAPWLRFLSHTKESRVYGSDRPMTIPEIVSEVFKRRNYYHYDPSQLTKKYEKLNYCVQYNESDFNFVSRLLEKAGIYYYFEHQDNQHVMILSDSPNMSAKTFKADYSTTTHSEPSIDQWERKIVTEPLRFASRRYLLTEPPHILGMAFDRTKKTSFKRLEQFHYTDVPKEAGTLDSLQQELKTKSQVSDLRMESVSGSSRYTFLNIKRSFELSEHELESENGSYYLYAIHHEAKDHSHRMAHGQQDSTEFYRNRFHAYPLNKPFHPLAKYHDEKDRGLIPITQPKISGLQTAFVVGHKDQEIYTDKYGRVKVQFHWDRYGQNNENSSCWIRVKQAWAGDRFGSSFIPRVGQEVLIFHEYGDPERPLVIGVLPHADTKPPFNPAKHPTQSGFRSHSFGSIEPKDGNEIRFEDKAGHEAVYIKAKKDFIQQIDGNSEQRIYGKSTTTLQKGHHVRVVDGVLTIEAKESINLSCGDSEIIITPTDIIIQSDQIDFKKSDDSFSSTPALSSSAGDSANPISEQPVGFVDINSTLPEKETSSDSDKNDHRQPDELTQTYWIKTEYPSPDQLLKTNPADYALTIQSTEKKLKTESGAFNPLAHGSITIEKDDQLQAVCIQNAEIIGIGHHKNLYPYDRIDAKNDDCIAANEQELSGEKLKAQDKLLKIEALYPPIIVNLREDRPENTPNTLTDGQVQYVKNHGNNATIFIHGFNVLFGQYDHHFSHLAPSNQNDVSFYPELDIIQSPTPCTIYRNHSMLKKQFPDIADLDEAHYPLQYRDFTDTPLNGIEAHNWFVHMEDNLNGATGQFDRSDYSQYTRLIHVAWSGDIGKACYLHSEDKADAAGERLVDLIEQLHQEKIEINIIAHSMGNRVLLKMMDRLGAKGKEDWIEHVFMCEAAVAQNALSNNPKLDISVKQNSHFIHAHQATKKITVLYSQEDSVVGWIYRFGNLGVDINQINHSKNYGPMEKRHDTERFGYYASRMRNLLADPNSANLWHTVEPPTVDREHLVAVENLMGEMNRNLKISATIRPALGHEGPDIVNDDFMRHLRDSGKLIRANTTPWIKSHSAMKIPTPEIMKHVYKRYIVNKRAIKKLGLLESQASGNEE